MEINKEKYKILKESIVSMKDDCMNIITLYGSAGFGKTHTTLEYLKEQDMNYTYINSYATPLSFYKLLYENRNKKVIIFDDLMGASNPLVLSMLKSACWISDQERIVSYHSTSSKMELNNLPESFTFTSDVILIFNQLVPGYEPITSRGITINFDFNFDEKIKIFEDLKEVIDKDVLNYIKEKCDESTTNLSIRTLIILSKLKRGKKDYKLLAREMLRQDEGRKLLLELSCHEWVSETGMSRRSYFRHKHKLKNSTPKCQVARVS